MRYARTRYGIVEIYFRKYNDRRITVGTVEMNDNGLNLEDRAVLEFVHIDNLCLSWQVRNPSLIESEAITFEELLTMPTVAVDDVIAQPDAIYTNRDTATFPAVGAKCHRIGKLVDNVMSEMELGGKVVRCDVRIVVIRSETRTRS